MVLSYEETFVVYGILVLRNYIRLAWRYLLAANHYAQDYDKYMIRLNISDFPLSYNHINGTSDMVMNKFDIARAGMVIGYPKLSSAFLSLGVSRFLELYFRTEAFLEKSNNFYQLKPIFHLIDSSEQKVVSYFFGQVFAKLFAEKYLNCDQVDNFGNHKGNVTFNNNGKTFVPKHNLYNSIKNPKEPDLIGFSNGGLHILEAKGYSTGFKGSEFQHAINQVSIVDKVNGIKPITKTACFFDLSRNPIIGTIKDPDSPNSSIDINFNKDAFIFNYYQLFNFKALNRSTYLEVKIGDNKFVGFGLINIGYDSFFLGVDLDIFEQINFGEKLEFKKKFYDYKNENMSIGPDGIIFMKINFRDFEIKRKILS